MLPVMPTSQPPAALRNQSGAFDLPSIMIGVAVVAILTVGVLAAIFGVIPWSQDRAAQQDLGAVHTAQGAALAKDGGFKSGAKLVESKWLTADLPEGLDVRAADDGRKYVGISTSKTGKKFIISTDSPTSRPLTNQDKWPEGEVIDPNAPDAPTIEAGDGEALVPSTRESLVGHYKCETINLTVTNAMQNLSNKNLDLLDAGTPELMTPYGAGGWDYMQPASLLFPGSKGAVFFKSSGSIHNASGAAVMATEVEPSDSRFCMAAIYLDGVNKSDDGPALIQPMVAENGYIEKYYKDNLILHRDGNLPAQSQYDNWKLVGELYQVNGETHRTDGPAIVQFDDDGNVFFRAYWINNNPINTFEAWVSAGGVPEAWVEQ